MTTDLCSCDSGKNYQYCCAPYHKGIDFPKTAEQLIRSRYTAYIKKLVNYLVETTHPDKRSPSLETDIRQSVKSTLWLRLTIHGTSHGLNSDKIGKVEFQADYQHNEERTTLHEISRFKRYKGHWVYFDGKII